MTCTTCNGRGKVQAGFAGEELHDCPDCKTIFRCETCQEEGSIHIAAIGCHFCAECLKKIDARIAQMNRPEPRAERLAPADNGASVFWWMPRRTDPTHAGWYYVREVQPRLCIGIRYFEDTKGEWWAVSKDGKNDGSLVPNETFHDWLTIPNISDRQRA